MKLPETPETDANCWETIAGAMKCIPTVEGAYVPAEFARKLERERDAAREALAFIRDNGMTMTKEAIVKAAESATA